jgi:N-acetylated-alpha-linked acidic dipeptidase
MARRLLSILVLTLLTGVLAPAAGPLAAADPTAAPEPLLGFTAESAAAQRELEASLDALVSTENLRSWMERLAARPHHVGSPWGKANAELMAGLFRSWGYETRIEEFQVLFPTPTVRVVEMLAPTRYTPALEEPAIPEDATSGQKDEQLPTYNAYSVDGDVTGELVYVNYGIPEDYEELARHGVSVAGKIVIARYGAAWRGIKPKVAAEHGAIGCLIYTDPEDDGYFHGDVYPKGGHRPPHGVQRGSVSDIALFSGDPLTPGVGATADAPRLTKEESGKLTKIPVLPLSWADAQPLLEALGGPLAPEDWRGGLPITYHLGPGPAEVRLKLEFDWSLAPAYDVIAVLPGAERPDQWVLRGNHHDAWVNGATDPISGMVALLEEARVVAELAKAGHRPKRTIVYAAWDAEEPGLLGSVEWAEQHADELREKAVAYVNTDSFGRGFLGAGGSHTLERLVNQVARSVPEPKTDLTVAERAHKAVEVFGNADRFERAGDPPALRLFAMGSGSDYTPFLQHLGVASLDLGFGGEDDYGQYHSIYDSIDHYVRFMDPDFAYGAAMAKTAGRVVLRLANADLLPFEFGALAAEVGIYVEELETLAREEREETEKTNRLLDEEAYQAAADPMKTYVPPERKEPVPHLNLAPLKNAHARLAEAAEAYGEAVAGLAAGAWPAAETLAEVDRILYRSERALTRPEGLPERSWYRHHLYAPGFYTGYGVKTIPGVREAIEHRDWAQAEEQAVIAAGLLEALAGEIDRAADLLRDGT